MVACALPRAHTINRAVPYHFPSSLWYPQPSTHLWVLKHYLKHSICLLEGPKGQKVRSVTPQVVPGQVLAGKSSILHLQLFLKQLWQFNLVNYPSKLLQKTNESNKFKVLVLQGVQILLPMHPFFCKSYICLLNLEEYKQSPASIWRWQLDILT